MTPLLSLAAAQYAEGSEGIGLIIPGNFTLKVTDLQLSHRRMRYITDMPSETAVVYDNQDFLSLPL